MDSFILNNIHPIIVTLIILILRTGLFLPCVQVLSALPRTLPIPAALFLLLIWQSIAQIFSLLALPAKKERRAAALNPAPAGKFSGLFVLTYDDEDESSSEDESFKPVPEGKPAGLFCLDYEDEGNDEEAG